MMLRESFWQLYEAIYSGINLYDDFEMTYDRYFPEDIDKHELVAYRELEIKHNRSRTAFSNSVNNHLIPNLNNVAKMENPIEEFLAFKNEIEKIYSQINEYGNFISLKSLFSYFDLQRSIVGIFELGDYCGIAREFHLEVIDNQGFIIPNDIEASYLLNWLQTAKGAAKYFGGIFPFDRLIDLLYWDVIPVEHIFRFSKELLFSDKDISVFTNDYYGFVNFETNTILTQLLKIYSIYEKTIEEHLEGSFKRTLKKKIIGTPSPKVKESEKRFEILDICTIYFVHYCIQMEWCESKGVIIFPTQKLKKYIEENPPEDKEQRKFYEIEKYLVGVLRKNGKPMKTEEFNQEMDVIKANKGHEQEFSFLFYRNGTKYNSTYHTLDDCYQIDTGEMRSIYKVDRDRVFINRINRNTTLARKIKQDCNFQCQLCKERIEIGENEFYAEAHHIQPLGNPHNGVDERGNIICVCPNCHVKLDYGLINIDKAMINNLEKNPIDDLFITYHNINRYQGEYTAE